MGRDKPSRYWKSWEQGPGASELIQISTNEFPEPLDRPPSQFSRRSFLKAAGFTAAVAATVGCSRAPVEKAIPYLVQPEEIVPGVSYFYASGCGGCSAGCGVLVKTRDGRPIKLEGNPEHPLSHGGLCAAGQASLLSLYDSQRVKEPLIGGKPASWQEADRRITEQLASIRASRGPVRFLSGTITSPTLNAEIQRFLATFPDAGHVTYDALSSSAILDAHQETHGARLLPHYRFDLADVVVSFDADFLGTWISPVEFTHGYRSNRLNESAAPKMSYHAQFESRLSITGAKADQRVRVAPDELPSAVSRLAVSIARLAGIASPVPDSGTGNPPDAILETLAQRLWEARPNSLVVSGSQDRRAQVLVNFINQALGNYGATLEIERPSLQKSGSDRELQALVDELQKGQVAALFILGANPVYDLPNGSAIADGISKTRLVVSFSGQLDETASASRFVCPDHDALESWGDAEPVRGTLTLYQPAIRPLTNTRPVLESLAAWRGQPRSAYDTLREYWRTEVFPKRQSRDGNGAGAAGADFQSFWDASVEAGIAQIKTASTTHPFRGAAVAAPAAAGALSADEFSLVLYPKVALGDGRHAHNPWLQELPDPISKITWDNYASVSPAAATRLGLKEGDVVRLELQSRDREGAGAQTIELPSFIQPGQHDAVVSVALGYGRKGTERFSTVGPKWIFGRSGVNEEGRVGKNAAPLLEFTDGSLQYSGSGIRLTKTGRQYSLASTQSHHTLTIPKNIPLVGGDTREIVHELTVAELVEKVHAAATAPPPPELPKRRFPEVPMNGMWKDDHPYTGHRWAIGVDLTACTGCGACVVACQAENNIPVVGKDEVLRHREMHWIRIDRYYSGEEDVEVVHQPMMCQQCDNAPCETVCPVLATVHSAEGLNQQIYNRCVGTRYCANNCPYKTRRFNWFNYARNDKFQNLALNPDVTVRSRGVMEKCTFCVQRIEAARIESRRHGAAKIADGQVQTACQQSCPAQAIVFGDLNDPNSRIAQMARNPRRFAVLEEFNFRPAVNYLAVVRNRESEITKEAKAHG
ncbi:MAG: TAT-variant-translocated molybdopterin oxidoreductase [Acidobacteria bacterium]|nr:TAT-variant-translocated molybdopterin oxidoreductase [Acidobacteriota bacterium]